MFQMDDQILQTCGIMFDNSSPNPFASRFQFCNIFCNIYCNIFMQHSLSTNFFHFFATTRLLQYCNSQGLTDQNRLVPDRGSRGSLVTVMGWQSRDFFKCLPPLFKSCTSATILPVSEKISTDQIDRLSGPWISIPDDSFPLIKYPNKQKIYSLYFSRCPVFHQKTGNLHLSTWRRPWVH